MGEEQGKRALQEARGGKADLVELRTSMGHVPRSLAMVPEGWEDAALSDLVKLKRGYDLPAQDRALSGDIQVIGGGGPNGFHNVAKAPAPGIVIGRSGAGIGNAWWSDKPFWPLNTGLYVTDFQANDPRFCFLLLDWIGFRSHNTGGAQPSLNRNFIYPIRILLPPLHEQCKIAEILRTWDQAIEKTGALLAAARTRKHGLIQILLTGKRRFSEFEGQAWREVRLREVATIIVSNVDKKSKDKEWPVRLCNYTDVYKHDIIESNQKFMESTATLAQIQKFRLNADDVIITKDSEMESPSVSPLNTGAPLKWRWAWRAADLPCWFSGQNLDRFAADGQRTLLQLRGSHRRHPARYP